MVTCRGRWGTLSLPPRASIFLLLSRPSTLSWWCVTLFKAQAGLTLRIARSQLQSLRKSMAIRISIPTFVINVRFAVLLKQGPSRWNIPV